MHLWSIEFASYNSYRCLHVIRYNRIIKFLKQIINEIDTVLLDSRGKIKEACVKQRAERVTACYVCWDVNRKRWRWWPLVYL